MTCMLVSQDDGESTTILHAGALRLQFSAWQPRLLHTENTLPWNGRVLLGG
jgi:hypothetical protein